MRIGRASKVPVNEGDGQAIAADDVPRGKVAVPDDALRSTQRSTAPGIPACIRWRRVRGCRLVQASDHLTDRAAAFGTHRPLPPGFTPDVSESFASIFVEARSDDTRCREIPLFEVSKQCVDGPRPGASVPDNNITSSKHLVAVESAALRQDFIVSHGSVRMPECYLSFLTKKSTRSSSLAVCSMGSSTFSLYVRPRPSGTYPRRTYSRWAFT